VTEFPPDHTGSFNANASLVCENLDHAGIKVNTRRAWKEAGDAGICRILCITKLDTDNINFPGLIDRLRNEAGVL